MCAVVDQGCQRTVRALKADNRHFRVVDPPAVVSQPNRVVSHDRSTIYAYITFSRPNADLDLL